MKQQEGVGLTGELSIYKDYHDGKGRILHFEKKNLIVNTAKRFLLGCLAQSGILSDPITTLKVGTGGCIDPQGLYPKAEDPEQTQLYNLLLTIPVTYTIDNPNIVVTFLADVDQSEGNGSLLNEAGLFKASDLMFNVKNHPAITKTAEFSVHYEWKIKYL